MPRTMLFTTEEVSMRVSEASTRGTGVAATAQDPMLLWHVEVAGRRGAGTRRTVPREGMCLYCSCHSSVDLGSCLQSSLLQRCTINRTSHVGPIDHAPKSNNGLCALQPVRPISARSPRLRGCCTHLHSIAQPRISYHTTLSGNISYV